MKKWIGGVAALTLITSSLVMLETDANSVPKKPKVELGVERLMSDTSLLDGKRVGLITNPTGVDSSTYSTTRTASN